MIKIDDLKNRKTLPSPQQLINSSVGIKTKESLFKQTINAKYDLKIKEEVTNLIKKIDLYGSLFTKAPSYSNLAVYKDHIRAFFNFATSHSYKIKEVYGRRIDYKIIATVNSKIETLSKEVMNKETKRIDMLSTIDEIRGLLVDFLL